MDLSSILSAPSITSSSTSRGFDNLSVDKLLAHLAFSLRPDIGVSRGDVIEVSIDIVEEIMEREGGLLNLSPKNWLSFSQALTLMRPDLANKNVEKLLSYINKFPPRSSLPDEVKLAEEGVAAYQEACFIILDQIMGKKLPNLSSEYLSSLSLALIETQAKLAGKEVSKLLSHANKLLPFSISQGEAKRTEESVTACRKAFSVIFNEIAKNKEKISSLPIKDLLSLSSAATKTYINSVLTVNQFAQVMPAIFNGLTQNSNKNKLQGLSLKDMLIFADVLVETKEIYNESHNFLALFNNNKKTSVEIISLLRDIKIRFGLSLVILNACSIISNFVFRHRTELLSQEKDTTILLKRVEGNLQMKIFGDSMIINSSIKELYGIINTVNLSLRPILKLSLESLEEFDKSNPEKAVKLVEVEKEIQKVLQPSRAQFEKLASSLKSAMQALISNVVKPEKILMEQEKQYLRIIFRVAETIGFSQEIQTEMGWSEAEAKKKGWFYGRPGNTNTAKADMTKATLAA